MEALNAVRYGKEYKERIVQGVELKIIEKRWMVGKMTTIFPISISANPSISLYYTDDGKEKSYAIFIWGKGMAAKKIEIDSCEEELVRKMIEVYLENEPETVFNMWRQLLRERKRFAKILDELEL